MKHRVALMVAVLLALSLPVRAFDFAVRLSYGDTLFFSITDAARKQVMVVAPTSNAANFYIGHRQPSGVLSIPANVEHNGASYTVTAIGERAFSGCTSIGAVTIPSTVTSIGSYAFYGCTGLRGSIVIGENIQSIGNSAFYGCSSITEVIFRAENCREMGGSMSMTTFGNCRSLRHIRFVEGVRSIPEYAFCGLDGLTDSIQLPASLETIGSYAFAYCNSISGRLVIPDKVTSIGECAFHQCHSLTSLVLGASVRQIGGRAFYHCIGLKQVTLRANTPPEMAMTSFSEVKKGIPYKVPCVSKNLYSKHAMWKSFGPFSSYGSCHIRVSAYPDNAIAGTVTGAGQFNYGDSVKLTVVCSPGYGFIGWSDGDKDNPRRFIASDNLSVQARMQPLTTMLVRDTIYLVDTVYKEGYKVVHDTVDFIEETTSINNISEINLDSESKILRWQFSRREKVLSVSLYNQLGECIHYSNGRKGSLDMNRFSPGPYMVRVETMHRVLRTRFFVNTNKELPSRRRTR
ncbi:MAG: leucine-rich repeat domain-containing protein [Bacteroidales bacterium]|nr:leucine-rich repeat domain-containing protein [Bacteroidales bacterium]